jgi:orotate phosphoribosyltransferase
MSAMADRVASALYRAGCLKFGSFKIKSGALSPYYIDLACLLSSPIELCSIAEIAADTIRQIMVSDRIDKVASIELKARCFYPASPARWICRALW